jgi:sec-independent protein translocase protein TatC
VAGAKHEGTFWDHLEVARGVLIRCVLYVALGTALTWIFRQPIFDLLRYPAEEGIRRAGITGFEFRIFDPAGGIVLMMQAALVGGLLLSAPLWLIELVVFIAPGLRPGERRAAFLLIPLAVGLFLGGAGFCYLISPAAFAFLFSFNRSLGVAPEVTLVSYLYFFLRLLLVFGLVFEMPLVIMFLVHFGIVSSRFLLRGWRVAIVVIAIIAAVATPTTDPITMSLMAGPMILLYFLSIALGRMIERKREQATGGAALQPAPDDEDDDPYGLKGGEQGLGDPR